VNSPESGNDETISGAGPKAACTFKYYAIETWDLHRRRIPLLHRGSHTAHNEANRQRSGDIKSATKREQSRNNHLAHPRAICEYYQWTTMALRS